MTKLILALIFLFSTAFTYAESDMIYVTCGKVVGDNYQRLNLTEKEFGSGADVEDALRVDITSASVAATRRGEQSQRLLARQTFLYGDDDSNLETKIENETAVGGVQKLIIDYDNNPIFPGEPVVKVVLEDTTLIFETCFAL